MTSRYGLSIDSPDRATLFLSVPQGRCPRALLPTSEPEDYPRLKRSAFPHDGSRVTLRPAKPDMVLAAVIRCGQRTAHARHSSLPDYFRAVGVAVRPCRRRDAW